MYECHSLIASCEVIIVDELTLSSIISSRSLDSFAFSGVTPCHLKLVAYIYLIFEDILNIHHLL